ncbi:DUF5317 domain-containing protein [Thermaerobacter subterraneus]|uniref:DUF5317 domain-containing protein n=1 Tax=Thermaerobacter subterraneus DSM 13965 TaxID=867903 RepID=K6Q125_9FIRM|nr:DUF5317 domain-containing protein [Thermaerobacter subterraneus]EKP94629.1 hypothetical protein ThesuDRAFT_02369 [Thermaerobacter subterraneus DSM 13965]
MFLFALALAMLVGWLRGGTIVNVARLPLRWGLAVPVPFAIRAVLLHTEASSNPWLHHWSPVLQGIAYGSMVILALVNRHLPGAAFLITGTLANALVIMANGGRMPVSEWAVRVAAGGADRATALTLLRMEDSLTHQLLGPGTRLPWLADIIPLPRPFPFPSVASAGDVVLAIGLMWLILAAMGKRAGTAVDESGHPDPGAGPAKRALDRCGSL